MWTSTAASGFGDRMIMLASLALLGALASTADTTATNAETQFFFFVPYLVASLLGGWLADRLPRKFIMLACDEMRGLLLLFMAIWVASMTGEAGQLADNHWPVRWVLAAIGFCAALFNPVRNAIVPEIIPKAQLQPANAVILVINVIASMVGMIIGPQLIDTADVQTVRIGLYIGAVFYLVSGTFYIFLKPIGGHALTPTDDAAEKAKPTRTISLAAFILSHKKVMLVIAIDILVWSAAAVVTSGIYGVCKIHHGLSGNALLTTAGYMTATLGIGMIAGAAIIILIRTRKESGLVITAALICAGVFAVVLAINPWMPLSYLSAFGVGVAGNVGIVGLLTVLQSMTPNHIRGRVMGFNALLTTFFSVTCYGAIWQMPNADRQILWAMGVLGVALIAAGLIGGHIFNRRGPIADPVLNVFWRLIRFFSFSYHGLKIQGKHHIPKSGPVLLTSNHTVGLDPLLLHAGCPRLIKWVMTTDYRFRAMEWIWKKMDPICLEKNGNDMKQIRQILQALKEGQIVGLFPEGGLQREHRVLQPFQPGVGMIARRSKATIVPVWISGTPQKKSMIWHFLCPSRSRVVFGEPFKPDKGMKDEAVVEMIRERMLALTDQPQ